MGCGEETTAPDPAEGVGTAVVDGSIGDGEWSAAKEYPQGINIAEGQSAPGRAMAMVDSENVYVAVVIEQPLPPEDDFLAFGYFNGNGGDPQRLDPGDDHIEFGRLQGESDFADFVWKECATSAQCDLGGVLDDSDALADPGTIDGEVAIGIGDVLTVLEARHPLRSGDQHDLDISSGETLFVEAIQLQVWVDGGESDLRTRIVHSPVALPIP